MPSLEKQPRVVDGAAAALGVSIANTVTLLALGNVVVGGGVVEVLGPAWLDGVRGAFEGNVFPDACRACRIRMTALAADAGLIGAALLARD